MEKIIAVQNLSISLKKSKKKIVTNLTFNIDKGEVVLLKGRNGSGKSTILRTIFREDLKKYQISGNIIYNGIDINKIKGKQLTTFKSSIGYVDQDDDYSGHYNLTVEDIIDDSINSFTGKKVDKDYVKSIIESFYFEDNNGNERFNLRSNPSKLSGGQQRILTIVANIICRPGAPLYIIDEPLNNLDVDNIKNVVHLIGDMHREFVDSSFIIVSHNEEISFYNRTVDI